MKKIFGLLLFAIALLTADIALAQTIKAVDNSQNAGRVEWVSRHINVGKVPLGVPVSGEFEVKNISRENLMLLQVRSNCHCTWVEWPQEPIPPGKSGIIKATYDAEREGEFYRLILVNTNFDPNQAITFALAGNVEKTQESAATSKQ